MTSLFEKVTAALVTILVMVLLYTVIRRNEPQQRTKHFYNNFRTKLHCPLESNFRTQRDEISGQLNEMKKLYGQQSCELLKLKQAANKKVDTRVSENGGWCQDASGYYSSEHIIDLKFAKALSKFLKSKTVGSFGDGPGLYKILADNFGEIKSYTAYDGAPYCETVTNGLVKFLDLTAPQYGLPIFDWVVSVEVGEHIPAQYEDIYIDNLARHAREGIILSWAEPGQAGLSHINNKAFDDVVAQMNKRDFGIDMAGVEILKKSSKINWLKNNIQVYRRKSSESLIEEDA